MAEGGENGACGIKRDDTIMVRKAGETGTDNLSRIQSVSSKHFEAMGEEEEGQEEAVDAADVDLEEGEKGKDVDGEGEGDEEDEIEEDPDKRNRLDGYYVAMGIVLGLCILGTLSYMTVTNISHKEPELLLTTEGYSSVPMPKSTVPTNTTSNETLSANTTMSAADGPRIEDVDNDDGEN